MKLLFFLITVISIASPTCIAGMQSDKFPKYPLTLKGAALGAVARNYSLYQPDDLKRLPSELILALIPLKQYALSKPRYYYHQRIKEDIFAQMPSLSSFEMFLEATIDRKKSTIIKPCLYYCIKHKLPSHLESLLTFCKKHELPLSEYMLNKSMMQLAACDAHVHTAFMAKLLIETGAKTTFPIIKGGHLVAYGETRPFCKPFIGYKGSSFGNTQIEEFTFVPAISKDKAKL